MLAYLVLAGNAGVPVDPALVARFDLDDLPEIPFQSEERIVWRNHDASVVFFGWQAFGEVAGIGSHWTIDEDGLTAFSGHCWPREGGWVHGTDRSWATQLRSYLRDIPDPRSERDVLFGHFTLLSLPAANTGWIMPDWANIDQLFVTEEDAWTAISNRAGLCASAASPVGAILPRSTLAAGWLVGEGWIHDQESGYWDVERPRAGSLVTIEPRLGARIIEPRWSPLYPLESEDPAPTYDELLNEVEQDIRGTIRAVAALPVEERVLSLSGGKDSRTLLAFILSEGVQDRFQFITTGSPERADPIVAKMLADRFGLDWSLSDPSERSAEIELDNVRLHSNLVEGMTSSWAATARPAFAGGVSINGTMGEGLRWGDTSQTALDAATIDEVLVKLRKRWPFDRLGVLRSEIRAYYESLITDWFHEQVELGIPLASLPALFMHESYLHARVGPDVVWNSRLRIDPYMTPVCVRANHRLPLRQRPDPRFHIDLQRRCHVELSKLPFERNAWYDERMYAHLPDAGDYRQIETVNTNVSAGRSWRIKHYADYRSLIEQIVLDRGNPLHELLDYDRVADRIAHGDASEGRARLVWGTLSAAVWTGRHDRQVKLERTRHSRPA